MSFLRKLADAGDPKSYASKLRLQRFEFFKSLIAPIPGPLKMIDVGGTQLFWKNMCFTGNAQIEITLLNVSATKVTLPKFKSVTGDAREMKEFRDNEFDIVFSNSVIEHVGSIDQQRLMARECTRIGKRLFLQTPNRFFPIEPHFLLPFMQFAPLWLNIFLMRHFNAGWYARLTDREKAHELLNSVRLLSMSDLQKLFPEATIYREKVFGLTKSFIVCGGWNISQSKTTI
jgi:ubiquinone/menaquinone biosynthesis C-methylase UbiE